MCRDLSMNWLSSWPPVVVFDPRMKIGQVYHLHTKNYFTDRIKKRQVRRRIMSGNLFYKHEPEFLWTFKEPRSRLQGIDSANVYNFGLCTMNNVCTMSVLPVIKVNRPLWRIVSGLSLYLLLTSRARNNVRTLFKKQCPDSVQETMSWLCVRNNFCTECLD